MKRLAALILIALLPAIAAGRGSSGHSGHGSVKAPSSHHKSTVAKRNARGKIARSSSAKHQFQASSPCPATGKTSGSCRGYVIDHKTPLACGGAAGQPLCIKIALRTRLLDGLPAATESY